MKSNNAIVIPPVALERDYLPRFKKQVTCSPASHLEDEWSTLSPPVHRHPHPF